MKKPMYRADEFKPTQWSTAKEKANFANTFVKFVLSGFDRKHWTKSFYTRLSNTFGHIAHYNQEGFWAEWFESTGQKLAFLKQAAVYPCYGDPTYTYSDVEKALQAWVRESGLIDQYRRDLLNEGEEQDRRTYERLRKKFERPFDFVVIHGD